MRDLCAITKVNEKYPDDCEAIMSFVIKVPSICALS
jgi:hypothetical protein